MLLMESRRYEMGIMEARDAVARRLELLQLVTQGSRADAEAFGGQLAATAGDSQGGQDQLSLTLFEVMIQADLLRRCGCRRQQRSGAGERMNIEIPRIDLAAAGEPCCALHDIRELAYVAR